jgi:4'-phosphopantetheinyl transferase
MSFPDSRYDGGKSAVEREMEISGREVHVWLVRTESHDAAARVERVLSTEERERAARFRFAHLRDAFTLARAGLRALLGAYLRVPPEGLRFRSGPMGKLALETEGGLEFNVSHSHGLASYTFTRGCEIGIDVERIRPLADYEEIARRFFSHAEVADLLRVPEAERQRAFFLCWTRKEAYIKAIGTGLATPLDVFRVTFLPGTPPRITQAAGSPEAEQRWSLHDLAPAPDYAGALAYRDEERPVTVFPQVDPETLLTD